MTEFIPDLRELEQTPGLYIPAWLSDHPIPGFKDAAGNFVTEGDWVTTAAVVKWGNALRLAKVLKVEEVERTRFVRWEEKPRDQWTPSEVSYHQRTGYAPNIQIREPYKEAQVTVLQYFDLRPDSWSRRQIKSTNRVIRYTGEVPYLR